MNGEDEKDLPLHDEAKAREKWRGGGTRLKGGKGTDLPASETDDARMSPEGDIDADGRPGKGSPGTIPPPD